MVFEIELSLFCDFFPLWGNIDPYTYRGASSQCKLAAPTQSLVLYLMLDSTINN